ncbi:hypothetical protein SASPL_130415 [Salvia splendens]|uniref:40S ribosomal protein S7 n=1 Tax=Salvia splendens TaxID=180675 RepID=A0A8X8X7A7_SALSN|nr:hypothetical protein SASPL_130415 [Salvia splendens]
MAGGSAVNDGSAWLDRDNDVDFSAVEFRTAPGGAEVWIFLRQEVNMFTALQKIHEDRDVDSTEFEESVAQALFDLENTNQDIKSELKDLYINSAVQIDVAVVIHAPYRLRKAFRKVHPKLVRELEKKFSGKDVIFVATRRALLSKGLDPANSLQSTKLCLKMVCTLLRLLENVSDTDLMDQRS